MLDHFFWVVNVCRADFIQCAASAFGVSENFLPGPLLVGQKLLEFALDVRQCIFHIWTFFHRDADGHFRVHTFDHVEDASGQQVEVLRHFDVSVETDDVIEDSVHSIVSLPIRSPCV